MTDQINDLGHSGQFWVLTADTSTRKKASFLDRIKILVSTDPPAPTTTSLRSRKKAAARATIVRAARQLIGTRGHEATRMRDIARAAGVSYQTLYNYFPGKGHVLAALLDEGLSSTRVRQRQVLDDYSGNLLASIDALQTSVFEAVAGPDRILWRVVLLERLQHPAREPAGLLDDFTSENLSELVGLARSAGHLSPVAAPDVLARTLFDLTEMRLLRFLLDPGIEVDTATKSLSARTRLVVSPYLN